MSKNRKAQILELMIKQQSWELQHTQQRSRAADEATLKAGESLSQVNRSIDDSEQYLRNLMSDSALLDVEGVQSTRSYLAKQGRSLKQKQAEYERATRRAQQLKQVFKEESLYIKGLESVKNDVEKAERHQQEKKASQENLELWLQGKYRS